MIQHIAQMPNEELTERLAMYRRQESLSTADWWTYEACREEWHKRFDCATCDDASGSIAIEVATITCPTCGGTGSLLPEAVAP